ncbi:PQQ-binding-like beta-propeller repeat protein [Streptomyces sp. 12297]
MTQPPHEPPNQPPVPPGYGHLPGPPQQQPGYPQQVPNPYAQPQQPQPGQAPGPNPYAQQPPYPQHPQQPPYQQHPQQPYPQHQPQQGQGFPPPPPGGGPRKQRGNKPLAIGAAVVAAALVLGTAGYFVLAGDDGDEPKKSVAQSSTPADAKPSGSPSVDDGDGSGDGGKENEDLNAGRKPGEDKVLWLKLNHTDIPGSGAQTPGMWVSGDTVAKVGYKNVTGYSAADGKQKWTVPLDGEVCGRTREAAPNGKIVVAFEKGTGSKATCDQLKQIDVASGKVGWTKEVAQEGLFDIMTNLRLAISGNTLVVARTGPTTGLRMSDGGKLFVTQTDTCSPLEYAGGSRLIAVTTCFKAETEQVEGIDPKTGKAQWSYKFPKSWKINKVYSVDPVIVDANSEDLQKRAIVVLNSNGTLRTQLKGEGKFTANCGTDLLGRDLQGCRGAFVVGNTFLLMTEGKTPMHDNEVVAFSLDTGKIVRRTAAPKDRYMTPLQAEGGRIYAYVDPSISGGKPGEIVSWPTGGGALTTVLRHPTPAAAVERSFFTPQIAYSGGRFFLGTSQLLGKDGTSEKLLMVFGK